jgi:hypothetical protein
VERMKTTQEYMDETWQILQQNKKKLATIKYMLEYGRWPKDLDEDSFKGT